MDRIERMRAAGRAHRQLRKDNAALTESVTTLAQALQDTRAGLEPIPTKGEPYRASANYTTGDEVTVNDVTYVALKYSRGKYPPDYPDVWEVKAAEAVVLVWLDLENGYSIAVGDRVTHNGLTWECIKQHTKSAVRVPLDGSQWWAVVA